MNKKGDILGLSWAEAGGVIFAIMLISGTIWFFARFSGIITGSGEERATEVSFLTLVTEINKLLKEEDKCASATNGQPIYISDDYAILGFDKDVQEQPNLCDDEAEIIRRPLRPDCPKDKVCLCLYKTDETFNDVQPTRCVGVNADVITSLQYSKGEVSDAVYQNIFGTNSGVTIFGYCDDWDWARAFGTQRMHVEKKMTNQGTQILIAAYDEKLEEKCDEYNK